MAKQAPAAKNTAQYGVAVHVGGRPNLEDRAHAQTLTTAGGLTMTVAMVADGIGGNVQGERAAELSIATVFDDLRAATATSAAQLPLVLSRALQRANTAVFEEGRTDRSRRGMGTTAVLAAVHENQLYLANVGDSRAYLVRDGKAVQITRDHTWAFEMHRQRLLTEAEIARHPKRHELVRSIGYGSTVDIDLGIYVGDLMQDEREAVQNQGLLLQTNDRLVLCSDGLIKEQRDGAGPFVSGEEMARFVGRTAPQAAAEALVARAVGRRADDNVSAVVVEMPGSKHVATAPKGLLYGLAGLALVLALGALAFFLLRSGVADNAPATVPVVAEGETMVAQEPTLTLPPLVAGQVNVISATSGRWEAGESRGSLSPGQPVLLPEGQPVRITNDSGAAHLILPDGPQIYLEGGAEVDLTATDAATGVELRGGRLLGQTTGTPLVITAFGAVASLPGPGLLGVHLDPASLLLTVSCLQGGCTLSGSADGTPLSLAEGQASIVGSDERAGAPEQADVSPFALMAPDLVRPPTPTATPTATETPTPTATRLLPTATRPPTATPTRPPTGASPTPVPVETEPPGGGTDPEPTSEPPPPTDEPEPTTDPDA